MESNSYAIYLISYSVEVHFHLIQTTACIAKGNYISTASICPGVVDSQSKPRQVLLPLYPLSEINRTVPRLIHDLSQWNIHYVALHSLDVSDGESGPDSSAPSSHITWASVNPAAVSQCSTQRQLNWSEWIEDSGRYKESICLSLACGHVALSL